ncbi:hypothetical protein ES703_96298 [subsurface metagenome]
MSHPFVEKLGDNHPARIFDEPGDDIVADADDMAGHKQPGGVGGEGAFAFLQLIVQVAESGQ